MTTNITIGQHLAQEVAQKPEFSRKYEFRLDDNFFKGYVGRQPSWDYMGYVVYKRTYARYDDKLGRAEEFPETIKRVVEGCFSILKYHQHCNNIEWDEQKWQTAAQEMFRRFWAFKLLPAGRGLWSCGTDYMYEHGSMALNNCAFKSTEKIGESDKPFRFLMDLLMMGVGVGFDTSGANKAFVRRSQSDGGVYRVPDSREGWVDSTAKCIGQYIYGGPRYEFDYSLLRKSGERLKGFGGVSGGPEPLKGLHAFLDSFFRQRVGKSITSVDIIDIMTSIGGCVVSGNVRRSAEIAIGDADDEGFIDCKKSLTAETAHRRVSNNSVIAKRGMDYKKIADNIAFNGEPAVVYLENARKYSRMNGVVDWKDKLVKGTNPCFAGSERLLTAEGEKTFEELVGNEIDIITIDNYRLKSKILYSGMKQTIKLIFDDNTTLLLTPNHVLMTDAISEIKAEDSVGKYILKYSNTNEIKKSKVVKVEQDKVQKVYDFQLSTIHWGYVNGFLVHNCGEQSLEDEETCNLVETFPVYNDNYDDFQETLYYAYLYSKSVTLLDTHWPDTNDIIHRNRRIGVSQSGIIDAYVKHGEKTVIDWCDRGYEYLRSLDKLFSAENMVNESVKLTTVKPSGTLSILVGVSSGIHYPHSEFCIRRVRVNEKSDLIKVLSEQNFPIEDDVHEKGTKVVSFPVRQRHFGKSKYDVTVEEQYENAKNYQRHWSDNQVSITISFKPSEVGKILWVLKDAEDKLKSVCFCPLEDHHYDQAPLESISRERYFEMTKTIKAFQSIDTTEDGEGDGHCGGGLFCKV